MQAFFSQTKNHEPRKPQTFVCRFPQFVVLYSLTALHNGTVKQSVVFHELFRAFPFSRFFAHCGDRELRDSLKRICLAVNGLTAFSIYPSRNLASFRRFQ